MPTVFNSLKLELKTRQSPIPEFSWKSSPRLAKLVKSEDFEFDIRSLDPGRFSFPYHFHRNAEEPPQGQVPGPEHPDTQVARIRHCRW
jgi:hypothetical protein